MEGRRMPTRRQINVSCMKQWDDGAAWHYEPGGLASLIDAVILRQRTLSVQTQHTRHNMTQHDTAYTATATHSN